MLPKYIGHEMGPSSLHLPFESEKEGAGRMTKLQIEKRNLLVSPVICAFSIKGNVDFSKGPRGEKF